MFILNINSKTKKIWISIFSFLLLSASIINIFLNNINYINGTISNKILLFLFIIVLIIPIFLILNLFLSSILSIIIIIINNTFSFKNFYVSLLYYNSINFFISAVCAFLIIEYPMLTTPILIISYILNLIILYLEKESLKKYASISNIATILVMILQILLITYFFIVRNLS